MFTIVYKTPIRNQKLLLLWCLMLMHAINFPVASSYLHCKSVSLNEWVQIFGGHMVEYQKRYWKIIEKVLILVLSALGVPLDPYPKLIIEIFRRKNQYQANSLMNVWIICLNLLIESNKNLLIFHIVECIPIIRHRELNLTPVESYLHRSYSAT